MDRDLDGTSAAGVARSRNGKRSSIGVLQVHSCATNFSRILLDQTLGTPETAVQNDVHTETPNFAIGTTVAISGGSRS